MQHDNEIAGGETLNPKSNKLIAKLQPGLYLVNVNFNGGSHALPITQNEAQRFYKEILGGKKP
jgi:hypothetical protein